LFRGNVVDIARRTTEASCAAVLLSTAWAATADPGWSWTSNDFDCCTVLPRPDGRLRAWRVARTPMPPAAERKKYSYCLIRKFMILSGHGLVECPSISDPMLLEKGQPRI